MAQKKYLDLNGLDYYTEQIKDAIGEATRVDSALSGSSENPVQNKIIKNALDNKVDKVSGKGLSTNDYTTDEKNKLAGIAANAEVNVNADWNAVSGDAQILNKPNIPSSTSDLTNDSGFITSYTETDPVFSASAAADITTTDIDNWNAKVSDDKTWNGVSLAKQSTTNSGDSTYVPLATSLSPVNMSFTPVKKTPTNNAIAKYDSSAYLYSTTPSSNDNSTKVATTAYVDTAIDTLPEPMVFKGSLGTGGTITTLPDASSTNEGFTYKVITAGTYASQAAKIGDTFISDGSTWILIPSGDEPSGTVTSITLNATSPIAIDSSSAITTSGSRIISHATSGVTAGTYTSVTVDTYGHVTTGSNPTTLSGYGITDASISSQTVTLGTNSVTVPTKTSDLVNDMNFMSGMTILSYGYSTWDDFITAYTAKHIVYTRASSGSNPRSGNQTRLAFMAYVNNADSPTEVEFQYYRSVSSHNNNQQGDQTYVYKLNKTNGWSVTVRENYTKVAGSDGITGTWSSGTLTLKHDASGVTAGTYNSVTVDAKGHVTAGTNPTTLSGYGITDAKIASGTITLGSNTITPLTSSSTLDATKLSGTIPSSCYTVPTKTSELTNDSDFITDASYTHTDNNYTDTEVTKLAGIEEGATVDDKTWNGVTLKAGTTLGSSTNYVPAKSNTTVGSGDAYYLPMSATPTANYGVKYTSSAMLQSTTPSVGTNSTIVATTAFVQSTISALTFANKFSTTITGDGSKTSFSVDHNLNTRDVIVQLYDTSTFETVIVNTVRVSNNTITLTFKTAPTSSESYKVIVLG